MKKSKKNDYIFNLNLEIDGWQGPFSNLHGFLRIAEEIKPFERYSKSFVRQDGRLFVGQIPGLHTYQGHWTLPEDHIHFDSGQDRRFMLDIFFSHGDIFLTDKRFEVKPHYTLEGLYNNLDSNDISKRIDSLVTNLKYLASYEANNLIRKFDGETNKSKLLNSLEKKYVELVSNQ